ncbi:hypothetical protein LXL04_024706 [Taraxacum kok-saghyz]
MSLPTPLIHHPPLRKGDSSHSNHFVSSNPIDNDTTTTTTTTDNNKTLDEHPASSPDSRTDEEDDGMIDGFRFCTNSAISSDDGLHKIPIYCFTGLQEISVGILRFHQTMGYGRTAVGMDDDSSGFVPIL